MTVTMDSTVVAASDQVSASMQGEAIVLGLDKGMYYGLDEVAALVWSLLGEPRPVAEIKDRIVAEFDVDESTCERDLVAFLDDMDAEGLIEVRHGQPG